MSASPLRVEMEDQVAVVWLDRPSAGNALNLSLARALLTLSLRLGHDPDVRCVVLRGTGRFFSVGGDLGEFAANSHRVGEYLTELAVTLHQAILRLVRMPKPLLVLVNGPAAGAGLSVALLGDVVLAARSAHFTAAYSMVGMTPDGGMSWLLPRLVGLRMAQELVITNRRLSSDDAAAAGLVTRVVDDAELEREGAQLGRQLACAATSAIGATRSLLLDGQSSSLEAHLDRELRTIAAFGATPDGREGVSAFLAKRTPQFSGSIALTGPSIRASGAVKHET